MSSRRSSINSLRLLTRIGAPGSQSSAHIPAWGRPQFALPLAPAFAVVAARGFAASDPPAFKSQLRSLYKKIHPDLFTGHPVEQEANSRSMQVLHEYLELAQAGEEQYRPRGAYLFEFYVREETMEGGGGDPAGTAPPPPLRRVKLALPPPSLRGMPGRSDPNRTSPDVAKGMRKLLVACGVGAPDDASEIDDAIDSRLGLLEFLPLAAERQRQGRHPGDDEAAGDRLQRARAALRVGREVSLSFSQSPATLAEEEFRAELAERLVSALDACPSGHLEGVAVVVGDKSGADHLGQVWLDAAAARVPGEWAAALKRVDSEVLRQAQRGAAAMRAAEHRAAERLGVGAVYAVAGVSALPDYAAFLARIFNDAPASPHEPAVTKPLGIQVAAAGRPGGAGGSGGGGGGGRGGGGAAAANPAPDFPAGFGTRFDEGALVVPVTARFHRHLNAAAREVVSFLGRYGPAASQHFASLKRAESKEAAASAAARRMLKLRTVVRDPQTVSRDRFVAACGRLVQFSLILGPLMEGLSIRISDAARVEPGAEHIDIPYDFQLRR